MLSTIFSDNKSGKDEDIKPVKLRFRVVADGGADAFDVDCPGVRVRNGVYVYPLGSTQKFNVWIDNRREYNEKEHPLVCELDGRYYANSGEPERNAKKVIYHYEITFTEVRDYKFSALLAGMAGSVEYTFQVLPQPDTILGRLKPFLKREHQEIISVEHDSPVVDFCRAPVKKIKCFPGVEFVLNKAVFNKNYVPDATSKSIEDRIFNGEAACYAPGCSWQILDPKPDQICTLEKDQSRIKILECGSFKLQLKSLSQDLCQEIEFKVVSDKSGQMMKLLAVGLLISIIFFGWFGADFWIFLCKAFTPAVVYYAGTHSKECLKSPGQKILFWITLVISYWGLFRGLWQEI